MNDLIQLKNNASTVLASGLSAVALSGSVVDASKLPSLAVDQYFYATIQDQGNPDNREVVKVTGISGNVVTFMVAEHFAVVGDEDKITVLQPAG